MALCSAKSYCNIWSVLSSGTLSKKWLLLWASHSSSIDLRWMVAIWTVQWSDLLYRRLALQTSIYRGINKCACHVQRTYSDVNVPCYTRILSNVPHNPLRLLSLILQVEKCLSKIIYIFLILNRTNLY